MSTADTMAEGMIDDSRYARAERAAAAALARLEVEAETAIRARDKMREAVRRERVDGLIGVGERTRDALAERSGWSETVRDIADELRGDYLPPHVG